MGLLKKELPKDDIDYIFTVEWELNNDQSTGKLHVTSEKLHVDVDDFDFTKHILHCPIPSELFN